MTTFADLIFTQRNIGQHSRGIRARHTFPNGYAVSVIQGPHTYGGERGLFECAVVHSGKLIYDTPVCNDVDGWLNPEQVSNFMQRVADLPKRDK